MTKFQKKTDDFKTMIMDEYLTGEITQKELGIKYNFHYRMLIDWFKKANRLQEYNNIQKSNLEKSSKKSMPSISKIKISGINSINWNGEKIEIKHGKISAILVPNKDHPNANAQGYVYKHRLVMEEYIGRFLTRNEIVHHIDLDPVNNKIDNLILLNSSEHASIHYLLQLALVKLLSTEQLQLLTKQLLEDLRNNPIPIKRESKELCLI